MKNLLSKESVSPTPVMKIECLDNFVLTVVSIETTCIFYSTVLGMEVVTFNNNRKALVYGKQKINLHQYKKEFEPKAYLPTPGSADLCFISSTPLDEIVKHLSSCGVNIIEEPVKRTGAKGSIMSWVGCDLILFVNAKTSNSCIE